MLRRLAPVISGALVPPGATMASWWCSWCSGCSCRARVSLRRRDGVWRNPGVGRRRAVLDVPLPCWDGGDVLCCNRGRARLCIGYKSLSVFGNEEDHKDLEDSDRNGLENR